MCIQAVLFDHDGTLVDSETTHLALWRQVLAPLGVNISDQEYWQTMLGVPAEQNAQDLVKNKQLSVTAEALVAEKVRLTQAFLVDDVFPALEGASDLLQSISGRVPMGLVSGAQRFCIEASLAAHGWESCFEHVVTGDEVVHNKPNPEGYLLACQLMGVDPAHCVALEDTQSGVRAAAAAGLKVVAIRNQWSLSHDFSQATAEVADLFQARAWFAAQLSG